MPSFEEHHSDEILTHSELLRDRFMEWVPLPAKLLGLYYVATVKYGDIEVEIVFDPDDNLIDIEIKEPTYASADDEKAGIVSGYIATGVEIDSNTAEVHTFTKRPIFEDGKNQMTPEQASEFFKTLKGATDLYELTPSQELYILTLLSPPSIENEKQRHPFPS